MSETNRRLLAIRYASLLLLLLASVGAVCFSIGAMGAWVSQSETQSVIVRDGAVAVDWVWEPVYPEGDAGWSLRWLGYTGVCWRPALKIHRGWGEIVLPLWLFWLPVAIVSALVWVRPVRHPR